MSSAPDIRLLREACQLALEVAFDGERSEPPVPAPPGLRQMFGFRKLTRTAVATVARAVDQDDGFRLRVAARSDEETVGRAGHLWLTRPEEWDTDPAWTSDPPEAGDAAAIARLRREREGAEAKAARYRQVAEDAEAARKRTADQLDQARRRLHEAEEERDLASSRLSAVSEERASAVRSLKEVEADLAAARHELRVARDATREAEAERMALQERVTAMEAAGSSDRLDERAREVPLDRTDDLPEPLDRVELGRAVRMASASAADLARALDEASALLDPPGPTADLPDRSDPAVATVRSESAVPDRRSRSGRRRRRSALPPGILEGSPEADRHLVSAGGSLLLVDGYNLARARWSGLTPEEERRRTVQLLEETQARSGARVVVVFDGASDEVSPVASRAISVRYSPTGVTADDVIIEIVDELADDRPVVVVSSDREVADGARTRGAAVLGSAAFLAATER